MKRIILLLLLIVAIANYGSAISIISGSWNRKGKPEKISLYSVDKGEIKEVASSTLDGRKNFNFAVNPEKASFYVIGESRTKVGNGPINKYTFYLKPNDNLTVAINETSYTLIGENTPENMEMQRWHELVQPLESIAVYFMGQNKTYVDFFPLFEEKLPEIDTFVSNTKNEEFNNIFANYRKFDLLNDAIYLIQTPRSAHPQEEDMPEYYSKAINLEELTATGAILEYPFGMGLINMVRAFRVTRILKQKVTDMVSFLRSDLPFVINDTIKSELVMKGINDLKSYEGLKEYNDEFGKYILTKEEQATVQNLLYTKAKGSEAVDAYDFKFKDVNNKDVSLSDFKGKVVYIDVWATWCGPCKKELPSLHKLEAEYKNNKGMVFMGVSTDDVKDYGKWKKFLVDNKMSGIQVFAGSNVQDIIKPYQIKGIPRFILIDKQGKIASSDAPRPSSSEIRVLLNATLKK